MVVSHTGICRFHVVFAPRRRIRHVHLEQQVAILTASRMLVISLVAEIRDLRQKLGHAKQVTAPDDGIPIILP